MRQPEFAVKCIVLRVCVLICSHTSTQNALLVVKHSNCMHSIVCASKVCVNCC